MSRWRLILLPLVVFITGLGVTWALWQHERELVRKDLLSQFDAVLRDTASRIELRMYAYEQMLRSAQSLYAASGEMSRDDFHDYVASLNLDANYSGIQSIGVGQWVPGLSKSDHLLAMRHLGFADYAVQPPGQRENYAPIVQREPNLGGNYAVLGFDMWSDPARRSAMEQARDTGAAALSGKVRLTADAEQDLRSGFLMYLALYEHGKRHDSIAARRAHLAGWVYTSFHMNNLMASLYGELPHGLAVDIYDGVVPSAATLLYHSDDGVGKPSPGAMSANEYMVIGGRDWTLSMTALDDFGGHFGHNAALPIVATGGCLSLLLALLAWQMLTGRSRAMQLAASMTLELRESEEKFRAIADCMLNWEIWWGLDGKPRWINPSVKEYTGYTIAECMAMDDFAATLIYPEDRARVVSGFQQALQGLRGNDMEVRCVRKDGSLFWLSISWAPISDDRGKFTGFRTSGRDITERKQAEAELRIAAVAFDSREGMMITDANSTILRVNRAFTEITGYSAAEVVGQTPRMLRSGRHDSAFYRDMWQAIQSHGGWQGEIWDRRKNGEIYPKWLTISAVTGEDGIVTHYVGHHHDITERKISEEKIRELAFFDALTHLPNRTLLMDRLTQAITVSARNKTSGALLFVDLDHFKTLNDTQGHDKGDLLLRLAAQRLAGGVREVDTVARVGGDEFVIVLGNLSPNIEDAARQTEAVGEKVLVALSGVYQLGELEYRCTASIGATLFQGHRSDIDELLKQADLAMYKAKETGRNALRFFDPAMQTVVVQRANLEAGLRKAIEGEQFLLHYQPQVRGNDLITGVEALVRWQHPQRGMVLPADFIPMAEETGLILPLGKWVLQAACTQLARWAIRPELAHLTISVNISAQQFRKADFVDMVLAVISSTGANPHRLKLELTESLLVDNVQDVIEKMTKLKLSGIFFSLDDFGTGYSSLSYLKRLPLDQLKIDHAFVRDILYDSNDAAIAETILALARNLGLEVIAEGIETAAQRDFLANAGCHAYQGYYFCRPLPVDNFESFMMRV